jgi:DNA-binding GntR family transcriptional regulator
VSRRRDLFVPPIALDKTLKISLSRQIHHQIARAIRAGSIPGDARLPSTRMLATLLGVSRNTVLAAYDDLAADGLIQGVTGSGMRITGSAAAPAATVPSFHHILRAARYPARVLALADPDGNSLYIRL